MWSVVAKPLCHKQDQELPIKLSFSKETQHIWALNGYLFGESLEHLKKYLL